MSSYKIWKMINEASYNLGLGKPNTVGIIGSNLTENPLQFKPIEGEEEEEEEEEDLGDLDDLGDEIPEDDLGNADEIPEEPEFQPNDGIGPDDDLDVPPELLGGNNLSGDVQGDASNDVPDVQQKIAATPEFDPGMDGTSSGLDAIQPLSDDDLASIDRFGDEESPVGDMSISGDLGVPPGANEVPPSTGEVPPEISAGINGEQIPGEEGEEEEGEYDDEDEEEEEEESDIAKSMRRFMNKDKKCCTCKKHCSEKCRKECPKCGKACKKEQEETEGFETEEQFRDSLLNAMREGHPRKHDDGMRGTVQTEDALYAMANPNADVSEDPQAGQAGFAPQGRVGGQIGNGWTQEDLSQIPTLENYLEKFLNS